MINLTWNTFNTEGGHDTVFVYDGNSTSSTLVYQHSGNTLPDPVVSSTSDLLVRFVADSNNNQGTGFGGIYESIPAPSAGGLVRCSSNKNNFLTETNGVLGCIGYENNVHVSWQIHVPEGFQILLQFDSFFTEGSYDYVSIFDGPSEDASLLGSYSGAFRPPAMSSASNYLFITFTSDDGVTRAGFTASYTSAFTSNDAESCFKSKSETINDESGSFGCSGYGSNVEVTWDITAPANTLINLEFTSFQTEFNYDVVTIYDGPNSNAHVLATVSGYLVPEPVRSTSNRVYVVFQTDGAVQYDGFTVSFRAEEISSSEVPACTASTSQTLTKPAGQFGCSGYANSLDSTWLVRLPAGSTMTMRFKTLNTEQFYDYVRIFDGPTASALLLGTFSGDMDPPAYTSSSNQMFVAFHSDSSSSAGFRGFVLEYASFSGDSDDTACSVSADHVLSEPFGTFGCDGYSADVTVTWKIASFANIFVNFDTFNTEPNCDVVTIYDGADSNARVLATYSGEAATPVVSSGTNLFITFVSDSSVNRRGFSASYGTDSKHPHTPHPTPKSEPTRAQPPGPSMAASPTPKRTH